MVFHVKLAWLILAKLKQIFNRAVQLSRYPPFIALIMTHWLIITILDLPNLRFPHGHACECDRRPARSPPASYGSHHRTWKRLTLRGPSTAILRVAWKAEMHPSASGKRTREYFKENFQQQISETSLRGNVQEICRKSEIMQKKPGTSNIPCTVIPTKNSDARKAEPIGFS